MKLTELKRLHEESEHAVIGEDGFFAYDDDVRAWLAANQLMKGDYEYNENTNTVLFNNQNLNVITLKNQQHWDEYEQLPVDIENWPNTLMIDIGILTSLKGIPNDITGSLVLKRCNKLRGFEGYPTTVGKTLGLPSETKSLIGISEVVKSLGRLPSGFGNVGLIIPMHSVTEGGLELLNIEDLKGVGDLNSLNFNVLPEFKQWEIINRHLGGNKDIFECQQELIENGFEEFAKL